jgi:hypothetical protein
MEMEKCRAKKVPGKKGKAKKGKRGQAGNLNP